jgi:hypothetical protein
MSSKKKTPTPTIVSLDKPLELTEIKTESAMSVRDALQSFRRRVNNAKKNPEKYSLERMNELQGEMDAFLKSNKRLDHSGQKIGMNGRQLLAQLSDLETSLSEVNDVDEQRSLKAMKEDLKQQLPVVLDREVYGWLIAEVIKLKSDLVPIQENVAMVESLTKKQEQDTQLRGKIANMKGYEDINALKGDIMKQVDISGSIPKGTRELLFHPVWLSRKLEKEFTVIIDRSHDTHSKSDGCYIAGTVKDVDACVHKLETFDYFGGKKTLLLDGKTLSSVMGAGGSRAYEIEKECGVLLFSQPGSVELTLYGPEKAVAKALMKIGDVKEISTSSSIGANLTSDRVRCNSAVAKAFQSLTGQSSFIEEECGVTITVNPVSESPRESWVVVRGPNEGVANAIHSMHNSINKMGFETVEAPSATAAELLLTPGVPKKGMSEVRLLMRFNDLKKRAVITRVPDHAIQLDVVTMNPGEMDDIVKELMDILARITWETDKFELEREHSRCWNEDMQRLVGSTSGAEITLKRHDDGHFSLEIWGTEKARWAAKTLIDQVHDARIIPVPEDTIKPMLENKCQVLQSIQADATVSAYFSKFNNELFLYGLEKNKRMAVDMFNAFVKSVREALLQSTIKSIPIASDEIGRLIGPKGRVMLGIKDKAQLEEIRISEPDMKVYLTGSNSSIDFAISLIEEELSAKKDPTVVQIGLAEDEETSALLSGASGGAKIGGLLSTKTNEWVTEKKETGQQEPVAVDSQDLFPSLGAVTAKPKPKMKWK